MIRSFNRGSDKCPGESPAHCWSALAEMFTRCRRLMRDHLAEHTSRHGISDAQFSLLWLCGHSPQRQMSQNHLVTELGMSAAHVSGSVERLRQMGFLTGERSSNDRRRQFWKLTDEGQAVLTAVLDDLGPWAKGLNGQFSIERRDELVLLLAELSAALSNGESTPPTSSTDARNKTQRPQQAGLKLLASEDENR